MTSEQVEAVLAVAHGLAEAGEPSAETAYRRVLAIDPAEPEALGSLGFWLLGGGRAAEAAAAFRRAAMLDLGTLRWLRAWAEAEEAAGHAAGALAAWRRILERRPDDAVSHRNIANLRRIDGDSEEAERHYREALHLDPDDEASAVGLAEILGARGDAVAALEVLQPWLRRREQSLAVLATAARAWTDLGEPAKAGPLIAYGLALDPADPFGLRALAERLDALPGLTPTFVRGLFDGYAERFDGHLVGRLDYRGPAILKEATAPLLGGRRDLAVLDVGCGTGLAGLAFRDVAERLVGSDLSPRMVEKAASRGIYDRLEVAEMTAALAARPAAWDLVVAADVLVYLGDLFPAFAAVAAALRPGGLFAATAERHHGGFVLGPARRYAHGEDHLRAAAAAAGLEVAVLTPAWARRERGETVPGWALVLRKPG